MATSDQTHPGDPIASKFQEGLTLHRQGKWVEAGLCYQEVVDRRPAHVDGLHLLGVVALQTGRTEDGICLFRKAIALNPEFPEAYNNLGNALRRLNQLNEALECCEIALRLNPDFVEAHTSRGLLLMDKRQWKDALASYDAAIALKPDCVEAHTNRCNVLKELGRLEDALESCDRAIGLRPDGAAAHNNRGLVLRELKRLDEALASYDRAIEWQRDYVKAHNNRGIVLSEMMRTEDALVSFDHAISLKPDYFEAYSNRGITLQRMRRLDEALASYEKAIELKPDYIDAWNNRGLMQHQLGRFDDALASFDHVIHLVPDYAPAYTNRGIVLKDLKRFDEALKDHATSLALNPRYANAHNNRGIVLFALSRFSEALACYDQAIALNPDYADAYFNKSLLLLLTGEFEQGWRLYEWRKKRPKSADFFAPRVYSRPLWLGDAPIAGKRLFIYWEQGFGDIVQFCRLAILAADRGALVFMSVRRSLHALLVSLGPSITLLEQDQSPDEFDFHCPLLSLPLAFNVNPHNVPAAPAYLAVDEARRALWRLKLGDKRGPRVGLAWSGSPGHDNDRNRSMPLELLLTHLPDGIEYICLQKELAARDRETLARSKKVRFFGADLNDFADTAALCDLMDLIVSVDTSIVHLGGAIGRETWVLLPLVPDWRWMLERRDSPWYASVRLFRQKARGDWPGVLSEVRDEMAAKFPVKRESRGLAAGPRHGEYDCPICGGISRLLDVVDFNKSCVESEGRFLPLSGRPVYYVMCDLCSFAFCPELWNWSDEEFIREIYNADYLIVDPEYDEVRPKTHSSFLSKMLDSEKYKISHLDYGGGNGKLSAELRSQGWQSVSYDPFPHRAQGAATLGKFNLITLFEVFEHVPHPSRLMTDLTALRESDSLILFATALSDHKIQRNQRLTWDYASPRNGHVSLYSTKSLMILGEQYGLKFGSLSEGLHFFATKIPSWARALVRTQSQRA